MELIQSILFDYDFGEENLSGFGHYGILLVVIIINLKNFVIKLNPNKFVVFKIGKITYSPQENYIHLPQF